jgi:hypothetical protein
MAEIIKHNEFESTYDDPDHPIPSLTHLEVCTMLRGGGAELHIVISKPLQSDQHSLNRLLDKIEKYLGHIRSPAFIAEAGAPSPEKISIVVDIHPESCKEAFQLLEQSKEWVEENLASLKVKPLEVG